MTETPEALQQLRDVARQRIEETRIAGRDTRHNRKANLEAVQSVVDGDSHYTWDIAGVERFTFDEILGAVSSITACSRDPSFTTGGGYISPDSTLKALEEASRRIAKVARRGGRFLLGTGHPGSLIAFYVELARLIRQWGGNVLEPADGELVPPNLEIGYINGVAVTTDRASLMHSHGHRAMDMMIQAAGRVDLIIADHGYASGAINAKIPLIAIMDTNDPALALARELGADLTIIPMDDNRPLSVYMPIIETICEFGEYFEPGLAPSAIGQGDATVSVDVSRHLRRADRFVDEHLSPNGGLQDLVRSFLESQRDQLLQRSLDPDEVDRVGNDPYLELALYRQIHEAFDQAVARRLQLSGVGLTTTQIEAYFNGWFDTQSPSEQS